MSTENQTSNVIAIDFSGSTGNCYEYWKKVGSLLTSKRAEDPNLKIILWDNFAQVVPYAEAERVINSCSGRGGTEPSCIVPLLKSGDNLTLITDGWVNPGSVTDCDARIKSHGLKVNNIEVYFQGEEKNMNLSVAAPFTRDAASFSMTVNGAPLADGSARDPIDLAKYHDNLDLFMTDFEKLFKTITVKCIGKFDEKLRLDILNLQTSLMNCVAKRNSERNGEKVTSLADCVGDIEAFRSKLVIDDDTFPLAKRVEMFIRALLKQVDGNHNFSFDQLRTPSALARAGVAQVVATEELPETVNVSDFECPVMLDSDVSPCILITEGEPVFAGVEPGYLKSIIAFPYLTLENNEFIEKIKARIDHPVSLSAAKHLKESPFTRKKVVAVLPLDEEVNQTVNKALAYALAKIFFGDKLTGSMTMWFSVVYFVICGVCDNLALSNDMKNLGVRYLQFTEDEDETKTVTVSVNPIMKNLEARMKSLMLNSTINLTLTGLPVEPMMKDKFSVALWYSLHSPFILNVDNDEKNRLRSFNASARFLVMLLELLGSPYTVDPRIIPLVKVYSAFSYMMKKAAVGLSGKYFNNWKLNLKMQYQNSLFVGYGVVNSEKEYILLDGPAADNPKPNLPNRYYDLPLEILIGLESRVDSSKSVGTIELFSGGNFDVDTLKKPVPQPETNYGYDYSVELSGNRDTIAICPATIRPYTYDRRDCKFWQDRTEEVHGCPLSKQISAYQYYIDYVTANTRYPSKAEFLKYMSLKQSNRLCSVNTLPAHIHLLVDSVLRDFRDVTEDVEPSTFVKIAEKSRNREDRKEMERKYLASAQE